MVSLRSPLIESLRGVAAVFFGRGEPMRPDPARLSLAPVLPPARVLRTVHARQVHSAICLQVDRGGGPDGDFGKGDALITSQRRVVMGIATADCLPIVAVDPEAPALGVIHAGWRGTRDGVLRAAIDAMTSRLAARPDRIRIAIGPGARACCYEVGPDVAGVFRGGGAGPPCVVEDDRGTRLDLVVANLRQARDAGVVREACDDLGICSICRPDLCHSYRRDGRAAGRMWLLAALT